MTWWRLVTSKARPYTIQIENLTFRYPGEGEPTLQGFTLNCPAGKITALIGPNGCGKSTLLDLVAGLKRPSLGSIYIDNAPPSGRTDIGFIFQKDNCLPWLTVEKNLTFGLNDADPQNVENTLKGFGLRDKRKTFPHRLSGGEQQRVAMARLALMNAGVILCDEPFSSTDSVKRQDMWDRLRALVTNNKATALVVTHEPQEALMHADFVCVLLKGPMRVCASLTLADGFRHNFELQKSAQAFYADVLRSGRCAAVPDCLRDYTEQNLTSIELVKTARVE